MAAREVLRRLRVLVRFVRRSVFPRLETRETYRGSNIILGMIGVLGAVIFVAKVISRLTSTS